MKDVTSSDGFACDKLMWMRADCREQSVNISRSATVGHDTAIGAGSSIADQAEVRLNCTDSLPACVACKKKIKTQPAADERPGP